MKAPGDQFRYLLHQDKITGHTTAIAYGHHPVTRMMDPIAVVQTTRDVRTNQNQRDMNRYDVPHGQTEDPQDLNPDLMKGQQTWTDGAFDRPSPTKVSWASMTARKPKVLRNLMGVLVEHHGTHEQIHADNALTEQGAALSEAMIRRYGVQPHPDNPYLTPNVPTIGPHQANEMNRAMTSVALNDLDPLYGHEVYTQEIPAERAQAAGSRLHPTRKPRPGPNYEQPRMF